MPRYPNALRRIADRFARQAYDGHVRAPCTQEAVIFPRASRSHGPADRDRKCPCPCNRCPSVSGPPRRRPFPEPERRRPAYFRADALDYLLKPISYAEFLRAAGKARRWFEAGTTGTAPASPEAIPAARNLFVRTDYKMQQIRLDDILYIEGMKDYVRIHTAEGGSLVTQTSMKAIEQSLPPDRFVRVHRSYIVQIDRVKTIERNRIVFGKTYIPVSESYKERFMEALSRRSLLL